jgi:tripartite-type tricarboxylate transporter receptor subunit TctC
LIVIRRAKCTTLKAFSAVLALSSVLYADAMRAGTQPFPDRPITLVVPFPRGGSMDTLARIIAEGLEKQLNVPITLEHLAGGGGAVGAYRVANANPDGYTLLIDHLGVVVRPILDNTPSAAPALRFEPLGQIAQLPSVVIARGDFPGRNMRDLLKTSKASGEPLKFSHAGRGSVAYLCGLMLKKSTGIRVKATGYKGGGPAVNEVLAGKEDLTCSFAISAMPRIQRGEVIPLGVTSKARVEPLSAVPTMQEQGLRSFELTGWSALYAPKGTPPEIVQRLHESLRTTFSDPAVIKRLRSAGAIPATGNTATLEYARDQLSTETKRWTVALKDLDADAF